MDGQDQRRQVQGKAHGWGARGKKLTDADCTKPCVKGGARNTGDRPRRARPEGRHDLPSAWRPPLPVSVSAGRRIRHEDVHAARTTTLSPACAHSGSRPRLRRTTGRPARETLV
jgi:hypothetical protein